MQENNSHIPGKKTLDTKFKKQLKSLGERVQKVAYTAVGIEEKAQTRVMAFFDQLARTHNTPAHLLTVAIGQTTGPHIQVQLFAQTHPLQTLPIQTLIEVLTDPHTATSEGIEAMVEKRLLAYLRGLGMTHKTTPEVTLHVVPVGGRAQIDLIVGKSRVGKLKLRDLIFALVHGSENA